MKVRLCQVGNVELVDGQTIYDVHGLTGEQVVACVVVVLAGDVVVRGF